MKKLVAFFMIFCIVLSLCACGAENTAREITLSADIRTEKEPIYDELLNINDDSTLYPVVTSGITKPTFGDFLTFINWYCYDGLELTDEQVQTYPDHPEVVQDVEYILTKDFDNGRVLSMRASHVIYTDRDGACNDDYTAYGWALPRVDGDYKTYTCGYTENNEYQFYELEHESEYVLSYLLDEERITIDADPELKQDARAIMYVLLTGKNYMTLSTFDEYLNIIDDSGLVRAALYGDFDVDIKLNEYVSINKWHNLCLTNEKRTNKITIDYITILDNYHIMYEQEGWEPIKYLYSDVHALALDSFWDFLYLNGYERGFSEQARRCTQTGRNYQYSIWDDTEQGGLYRITCMMNEVMIIMTADAEMKWEARDLMTQMLRWRN